MPALDSALFWQWCNDRYTDADLREALLLAQDDHQLNVLELLLAAWLVTQGRRYGSPEREALWEASQSWEDEVVRPLRRLRRQWRGDPERWALGGRVQDLELAAEQALADLMVESVAASPVTESANPFDNLAPIVAANPAAEAALIALARQLETLA